MSERFGYLLFCLAKSRRISAARREHARATGQSTPLTSHCSDRYCVITRTLAEFCLIDYRLGCAAFNPQTCAALLLFLLTFSTPAALPFIGIRPFMKTKFTSVHNTFPLLWWSTHPKIFNREKLLPLIILMTSIYFPYRFRISGKK